VNRVKLFKLIAVAMPFLVLGLLELALRTFHYGNDLSLFVEYPADHHFLVFNPDASKRYFSDQENATKGNIELFRKKKDPGTLRIFILGESTTIGYPYFHNGSFHRWLEYRLMHTFPDRNFEIVNLSLTAINSYTVFGFARELVNYEPDAVLIYTGHNEYYGAMGVGSTQAVGGNSSVVGATLWLRGLRVVQLMTKAYDAVTRLFEKQKDLAGKTRMEIMAGGQLIPFGSKLFNRGIDQFRKNMELTLSVLHDRHIPVFVSNLVSNEKDLPPFISTSVDSVQFPSFSKNYGLAMEALAGKDSLTAYADFKEAEQAYGGHAMCNYWLGRLAYRQGSFGQAKAWFAKARELDELRFRAPEELNQIIARLCQRYDNAHLVDTDSLFEAQSDNHIIGNKLILEHVHPNLYGYALLSEAFYLAMKSQALFRVPKEAEIPFSSLMSSMPITKVDSLTGVYKVFSLKDSWPFSKGKDKNPPQVASEEEELAFNIAFRHMPWPEAMSNLYDYFIREKDLAEAGTVVETLVLEHPTEPEYYERAANIFGELHDNDKTIFYFRRAFALSPSFDKARYLFVLNLKLDRPADALPYLDYAIQNNTSGIGLSAVKQYAEQIVQWQKLAQENPADKSIISHIADAYLRMGDNEAADKYAKKLFDQTSK
jgi:tetratricopeptide (TPR) repeat protein